MESYPRKDVPTSENPVGGCAYLRFRWDVTMARRGAGVCGPGDYERRGGDMSGGKVDSGGHGGYDHGGGSERYDMEAASKGSVLS